MAQSTNPAAALANIYRTPELWQKIVFTFVCLLIYRAGAHVTAPGVDVQALTDYFANQRGGGGLLGLYDLFVGGGLSRATVFALGIMPYISASIFIQIAGAVVPTVDKMQKDEEGRKRLNQWTRYITVAVGRVMVQIPQRTMARGRMREATKNFIPLRINTAGVMPIIFAQSVIVVPGAAAQFSGIQRLRDIAEYVQPGTWLYYVLMAVLIVVFTYFYTAIIFNPVDLAENLKKQGGFVPGVKPGAKTAEYIDEIVTRITLPGAIFLTLIALLPIWLGRFANTGFSFGGTSLLLVV